MHKHSQTCKKRGKAVCRFGFPLLPLEETLILEPLESDVDKYKKMYDDIQKQLNDMKNGCDLPYKELLSTVLKISEEDYIIHEIKFNIYIMYNLQVSMKRGGQWPARKGR